MENLTSLLLKEGIDKANNKIEKLSLRVDALEKEELRHHFLRELIMSIINKWYFWVIVIGIMMCLDFTHVKLFIQTVAAHLSFNMESRGA